MLVSKLMCHGKNQLYQRENTMIRKTNKCRELIRLAIHSLNSEYRYPGVYLFGAACAVQDEVRMRRLDPRISDWAEEWKTVCNRNWNEWGLCENPLTDDELKQWIRTQLMWTEQ